MVSVIITTFNYGSYIENAIRSIIAQTYTDWEIVVVDDASTDNTEELVKTFKKFNITYVKNPINVGTYASRDIGFSQSKGHWVCFLDADDLLTPDSFEIRLEALNDGRYNATHTALNRMESDKLLTIEPIKIEESNLLRDFVLGKHPSASHGINLITCLADRETYIRTGKFTDFSHYFPHNDYAHFLKMTAFANFVTVNKTTYIYTIHENSHSAQHGKNDQSASRLKQMMCDFNDGVGVFSKK